VWTEVVWLRAGTSGGPWWNTVMIIFQKIWRITDMLNDSQILKLNSAPAIYW